MTTFLKERFLFDGTIPTFFYYACERRGRQSGEILRRFFFDSLDSFLCELTRKSFPRWKVLSIRPVVAYVLEFAIWGRRFYSSCFTYDANDADTTEATFVSKG